MAAETAAASPLSRVAGGVTVRVVAIEQPVRGELAREGLVPGAILVVQARGPAGGPLVVRLGRARIALSADVAARIATVPAMRTEAP